MLTYETLDEVQKAVLEVASEEGLPWEVLATWRPEPSARTSANVEQSRSVAGELVERGLVWMYRIAPDSHIDLTRDEVWDVLGDAHAWNYLPNWTHDVALYLTPGGESLYYGTR
jgi:hypothetical protein